MSGRVISAPVGREHELALIRAAIAEALGGSVVSLALRGTAGCGKTTLWRAAIEEATRAGFTCLAAAPTSLEASLAYAVLGDLMAGMADERLEALPPPQRTALRAALQLDDPGVPVTDHATAAGLRGLLARLVADGPVCIAVDDVQWADIASRRALSFATRRLGEVPLLLLFTRRTEPDAEPLSDVDAWPGPDPRVLSLGALSAGAIHHILRATLGATFPRPQLVRITSLSAGNPLLAIEIVRAILATGGDMRDVARAALEVPTAAGLLGRRMAGLSDAQRRTLVVAALVEGGSVAQAVAVHGMLAWPVDPPPAALGLAAFEGPTIRFHHPLYAEALLAAAPRHERTAVHRAVAAHAERIETRARHLAEATDGFDEALAVTLDAAVRHSRATGALDEACELARLAVGRTPPGSELIEDRVLLLAALLFQVGDPEASARLLEAALERVSDRARRVEIILRMTRVFLDIRPASDVRTLCTEALDLAAGDPIAAARAHLLLAEVAESAVEGLRLARAAVAALGPNGPDELRAHALNSQAILASQAGHRVDMSVLEAAVRLETTSGEAPRVQGARFTRGWLLVLDDELDRAREDFLAVLRSTEDRGEESDLPTVLAQLGHLELRGGNWRTAREWAVAMLEASERSQQRFWAGLAHVQLGTLDMLMGDAGGAVEHLGLAQQVADELGDGFLRSAAAMSQAMGDLSRGRIADAQRHLGTFESNMMGRFDDPSMMPWAGIEVEAAARAGDAERAIELADDLERRARRLRRARTLAVVQRGRAVVAAMRGDLDSARGLAGASARALARLPAPFEEACSLLVLGSILRRRREKRAAHDTLNAALAIFDRLGAATWSQQAMDELGRIGLRPRAPSTLTESEERVARLAAEGHSNRAIASAVFVSPKTVEATLGRVYLKLDIRRRAELGVRLAALTDRGDRILPPD